MLKKIALILLVLIVVLAGAALVFVRANGLWNLIFPSSHHESVAPELPANLKQPAVLVFSKTNSFRHIDGIRGGDAFFEELAGRRGWGIFFTENSAVFNARDMSRFNTVIFNNVTGDVMSEAQEQAFQRWLEAGGGWLGIHAAGDGSHEDWPWYVENLIGAEFTAHTMGPQFQEATVQVEDTSHIATRDLPLAWQHAEEWYSWERSPRDAGFNVLASVDESTYQPRFIFMGDDINLSMDDHPVVWNRCLGAGRALYSALGHRAEAFASSEYQQLLEGAVEWTMGDAGCGVSDGG